MTDSNSILPHVERAFAVSGGNARKAHAYLAQEIAKMPDWFQGLVLHNGLQTETSAMPYIPALLGAFVTGTKGYYVESDRRTHKPKLKTHHYHDIETLTEEISHRADRLLIQHRYIRPVHHEYGGATSNDDDWRDRVQSVITKKNRRDKLTWQLTVDGNYKLNQYPTEAFAKILTDYVGHLTKTPASADARMQADYPELWPVFKERFLPKLETMGRDLTPSLEEYLKKGNWSIVTSTKNHFCLKSGVECIALDMTGFTSQQAIVLLEKLDALDQRATINYRGIEDHHYLLFKRDHAEILERKLSEAGKLGTPPPAQRIWAESIVNRHEHGAQGRING